MICCQTDITSYHILQLHMKMAVIELQTWQWLLHIWVPEHRWYCWRWHRDCVAVSPPRLALQSWCTSCPSWWYHRQTTGLQETESGKQMVSVDLQLFTTCSPNIEVNDEDNSLRLGCPHVCSPNIEVNDEDNSLRLGCPHRTRLDESIYTFVPFGCFGKNVSH